MAAQAEDARRIEGQERWENVSPEVPGAPKTAVSLQRITGQVRSDLLFRHFLLLVLANPPSAGILASEKIILACPSSSCNSKKSSTKAQHLDLVVTELKLGEHLTIALDQVFAMLQVVLKPEARVKSIRQIRQIFQFLVTS
jgi:hypothetical protein